jgi:hypothetical protein
MADRAWKREEKRLLNNLITRPVHVFFPNGSSRYTLSQDHRLALNPESNDRIPRALPQDLNF